MTGGDEGRPAVPRWARRTEVLAAALLGLTLLVWTQLPWLWGVRADRLGHYPQAVFTGTQYTYADDATTYLSWMRQARDGRLLMTDLYTPDEHPRNYINILFWSLGSVSRITGLDVATVYAGSRMLLGALLMVALYLLARRLFRRPGERLACFAFLCMAGGWEGPAGFMERNFGWSHVTSPAWWTPEMSTLFSMMLFPHFLAGFVAMVATALLLLPAWTEPDLAWPLARRRALLAGGVLFLLTFFHPYDVVNLMGLVWATPLLLGGLQLRWPGRELAASGWATLVWLPAFLYNWWIFQSNPAMRAWDLQNIMTTPEPDRLVVALGIGGVLALVALGAARSLPARHRVMLAWLLATLAIIHLPLRFQRRMIGGIQFPLAALAVAALALVVVPWLRRLAGRAAAPSALGWETLALAALILPLQAATPYYVHDIEWGRLRTVSYPAWLLVEEQAALRHLEQLGPPESIVLSSYEFGNFVPPLSGQRCYIGHYALTVNARDKKADVARFYAGGPEDEAWRLDLLRRWQVAWVVHGRFERELGDFDPRDHPWLEQVYAAGEDAGTRTAIYAVRLEGAPPAASLPAAATASPASIPSP